MTLIATVATSDKVVQVSDRRQTTIDVAQMRVVDYDDKVNKAVAVHRNDARFAVGCAGLGSLSNLRTDEWVLECLGDLPFDKRSLREAQRALQVQAEQELRAMNIPRGQAWASGLTFVLAGVSSTAGAFITSVSNVERPDGSRRDIPAQNFFIGPHYLGPNRRAVSVKVHGATSAVSKKVWARLNRLKKDFFLNEDVDTIARELVSLIRQCAEDPAYGQGIGRDCMSIALGAGMGNDFIATYHTEGSDPRRYGPSLVAENMMFKDYYEEGEGGFNVRLGPTDGGLTMLRPGQKSGQSSD